MGAAERLPGMGSAVPPHSLELGFSVAGIDPSSKRISLAVVGPAENGVARIECDTLSLPARDGPAAAMAGALEAQVEWFERTLPSRAILERVYLEEPFPPSQKHRGKMTHIFAFGVTLAALGAVGIEPVLIAAPSWKKQAMGQGFGFAKPDVYFRWAQSVGYAGMIEDEAAALGVATAGAVLEVGRG